MEDKLKIEMFNKMEELCQDIPMSDCCGLPIDEDIARVSYMINRIGDLKGEATTLTAENAKLKKELSHHSDLSLNANLALCKSVDQNAKLREDFKRARILLDLNGIKTLFEEALDAVITNALAEKGGG